PCRSLAAPRCFTSAAGPTRFRSLSPWWSALTALCSIMMAASSTAPPCCQVSSAELIVPSFQSTASVTTRWVSSSDNAGNRRSRSFRCGRRVSPACSPVLQPSNARSLWSLPTDPLIGRRPQPGYCRLRRPPLAGLDPAIPIVVVPLDVAGKILLVAGQAFILRQFDVSNGVGVALAGIDRLLYCGRQIKHVVKVRLHVVLVANLASARAWMTWNQTVPIHSQDFLHRVFLFRQVGIRHDAELSAGQRQEIDYEDDLFLGQPHDERVVAVVLAEIEQLQRRAAELDLPAFIVDDEIRNDDVGIL